MPRTKSEETFRFDSNTEQIRAAIQAGHILEKTERKMKDDTVKPYTVKIKGKDPIPVTRYFPKDNEGIKALLAGSSKLLFTAVARFIAANQDGQIRAANVPGYMKFLTAAKKSLRDNPKYSGLENSDEKEFNLKAEKLAKRLEAAAAIDE